jgi:ParB/RepB/Spo0J family partition protein
MKKYIPQPQPLEQKHHLDEEPRRDDKAMILPLSAIHMVKNDRVNIDGIESLAASIDQHGLLQPLVVRKASGRFELVAGHRRYLALKHLGRPEAAVRIENTDEKTTDVLRLIENIYRENLSGWETCLAIHSLSAQFDSQKQVADAIQKDKSYVSKCIAVVKANPEVERVQLLSLREIFKLYGTEGQHEKSRKVSGPIPGGRYGAEGCLTYRENKNGNTFSLRLNIDAERTPPGAVDKAILQVEEVLVRLKKMNQR